MELYHQGHWLCSRLCAFSPWPSGTISSLHLPLLARPQVSRGPAISFLPFLILKLNTTSGPLPVGWEHALLQHTTTPAQNTDTGLHYLRWCQKVFKKKKQLDVSKIYEEKVWEETCMLFLDLCAPGHLWLLSRKCLCHAVCAASWATVPVRWWDPLGKCFPVCKREQTETCDKAYWNGNKLQKITQVMKLTGPQT